MSPFEDYLNNVTTQGPDRLLPGCILVVADKYGHVYSRCFGTHSVDQESPLFNKPLSLQTTMWYASCTKLVTAVAALQCVEKGLLDLDRPIADVLSEWSQPQILKGFDKATGQPVLEKAKNVITLRMLLTHQSGLGYTFIDPKLEQFVQYQKTIGQFDSNLISDSYLLPLLFEPGTSWAYGVGSDWAGKMIERVNNNQSLNSYMQENIWKPLGMESTTFRLQERLDVSGQLADMTLRAQGGTLKRSPHGLSQWFSENSLDDLGGAGVYSCAADYSKLLVSLLKNDGTILKPESVDLLFTPSLSPAARTKFQSIRATQNQHTKTDTDSLATGGVIAPVEVNYALGGMVVEKDADSGRREGSLSWGGLPNLSWIIDRKSGLALLYASQLLPPGDTLSKNIIEKFERAVYDGELEVGR